MNALALVVLTALAMPALAKDTALTPDWNGIWAESSGQHRCAVDVASAPRRARLTLLCQFGPDAAFSQSPIPAFGEPIYLVATRSDFGSEPAGAVRWGTARLYAVCNEGRPEIIGTAYTAGAVSDVRLHPLTPVRLCGTWGGQ